MWPIPTLKHEFVSVLFCPDSITCSWIQKTRASTDHLVLRAYKKYALNNLELYHLIIFNPTLIKKYITSFLYEHDLQDAFVTFCLQGSGVTEHFIVMPTSTPHYGDFTIANAGNVHWEYRYLYPNYEGQYIFYAYAVPRSLILQYQLIAMSLRCNVIAMTTKTAALFDAYKNIFGTAFRKSQLAVDMMRHENNIQALITDDAVRRMISFAGDVEKDDYSDIAAACGIFCAEGAFK